MYKQIEKCGRLCYKSEDKITEDSYDKFVKMLVENKHYAMLEHGTVYLSIQEDESNERFDYLNRFFVHNPFSDCMYHEQNDRKWLTITTNYRVLVENNMLYLLDFWCEPDKQFSKRFTIKWTMDRIGSQSLCRHRLFSFAQESTRYCNYSKDKFDNNVSFIVPDSLDLVTTGIADADKIIKLCDDKLNDRKTKDEDKSYYLFLRNCAYSENAYLDMLKYGDTPQIARYVLPTVVKTEIYMTGFAYDWQVFFGKRITKSAHPDIIPLAQSAKELIDDIKYLDNETSTNG